MVLTSSVTTELIDGEQKFEGQDNVLNSNLIGCREAGWCRQGLGGYTFPSCPTPPSYPYMPCRGVPLRPIENEWRWGHRLLKPCSVCLYHYRGPPAPLPTAPSQCIVVRLTGCCPRKLNTCREVGINQSGPCIHQDRCHVPVCWQLGSDVRGSSTAKSPCQYSASCAKLF